MTLEVLNDQIRSDNQIKGQKLKNQEYKLLAFADDLAFILDDPQDSINNLILMIQKYGKLAGLKINFKKTKILVKNMTKAQADRLQEQTGQLDLEND